MKNYDELTDNLLKRRDCYVTEQKKKKKTVINVVTSMCCLCFVALLGFGVWHGGMLETVSPDTSEGSVITGNPDSENSLQQTTDSDGETVNNSSNIEQADKTITMNIHRIVNIIYFFFCIFFTPFSFFTQKKTRHVFLFIHSLSF